jgi:hypothetical protein
VADPIVVAPTTVPASFTHRRNLDFDAAGEDEASKLVDADDRARMVDAAPRSRRPPMRKTKAK